MINKYLVHWYSTSELSTALAFVPVVQNIAHLFAKNTVFYEYEVDNHKMQMPVYVASILMTIGFITYFVIMLIDKRENDKIY